MIEDGNENKKLRTKIDRIILRILPCNNCWGIIIVYPYFIWLKVLFGLRKQTIIEFSIGYMINPTLNINKAFRKQANKCMETIFGTITKSHIKTTLAKNKTRVLELSLFYETRQNPKKYFKVLSCVIYTIISNYVCIDYLACE